ncbi:thymidine phosphorylase [Williamsoniiplasma luminosum]|uniref:Thymidine phosphorylase n=1 Tax=Williamsoniiplasma luminosum TaxID=214888 RepID=A0A2K8NUQ4_9MOLU|nr:thymidine phosphorylase [Williamsoniiplasma luminosum]ATZ17497.1 thymidine phosphorylase [Williamsoniiplasma luminosum]
MNYSFKNIITHKKEGKELSKEEIKWIVNAFLTGEVTDYQMAAFLATIYFKGMSAQETADLTSVYVDSGKTYDLSAIKGWKADKHSTGGIGDKISFIFSPLVASYGIKVAKLSGRALGQTGGTIDKLESIPGWNSELTEKEFIQVVEKTGLSIIGSSANIAPADKKIYALRDVVEMVDSIPLIAASIMSKKLVIDADSIVLDVKVGSGAFMKDIPTAVELSRAMVDIGKAHNRQVVALITDMDKPLGRMIGNALEIKEAWETLHGNGPEDIIDISATAVGITLVKAGIFKNLEEAKKSVMQKLKTGEAAHYLVDMIKAQGGDWSVMEDYDKNFATKNHIEIKAEKDGYMKFIDAQQLGFLAIELGAGRKVKEDHLDHAAGIYLNKVSDEKVQKGDVVMTLLSNKEPNASWNEMAKTSFDIVSQPFEEKTIKEIIE